MPPKRKTRRNTETTDEPNKKTKLVPEIASENACPNEEQQGPSYWLMKAEPDSRIVKGKDVKFSIDDLKAMNISPWDGVRNHEAKNLMKSMKSGDQVFFYHSDCKTPGIAGICEVVKESYPDHTAFDSSHPYYDSKYIDESNPRWYMVDVKYVRHLNRFISLKELQKYKAKELSDMQLVTRGRLSVQRVKQKEWEFILNLEDVVTENDNDSEIKQADQKQVKQKIVEE
ncbi:EVE domain-containing protein [Paraphysoderma sedebokerense]|nr:EVE domain-containing protein [Paraphysoderma sedebokerense]